MAPEILKYAVNGFVQTPSTVGYQHEVDIWSAGMYEFNSIFNLVFFFSSLKQTRIYFECLFGAPPGQNFNDFRSLYKFMGTKLENKVNYLHKVSRLPIQTISESVEKILVCTQQLYKKMLRIFNVVLTVTQETLIVFDPKKRPTAEEALEMIQIFQENNNINNNDRGI